MPGFHTPQGDVTFVIPDEWWAFAEMLDFRSTGGGFYPSREHSEECIVVSLTEIEPPIREGAEFTFRKYKLLPVLFAFNSPECALPPVEVTENVLPSAYRYKVKNGYHRYYASVAVGFDKLPVVVY